MTRDEVDDGGSSEWSDAEEEDQSRFNDDDSGRVTKMVQLEGARWGLRVRFPARWYRQKSVGDLLELVASTVRSRSLEARPPWCSSSCSGLASSSLQLGNYDSSTSLSTALSSSSSRDECVRLSWRASWRASPNQLVETVPGEALRSVLLLAGGEPERYRSVCTRFRDEASAIVRHVRCDGGSVESLCRIFPRCETLVARSVSSVVSLRAAVERWGRLSALDVGGGRLEATDDELASLLVACGHAAPALTALDVSESRFGARSLAELPRTVTALDVSATRLDDDATLDSLLGRIDFLAARELRRRRHQRRQRANDANGAPGGEESLPPLPISESAQLVAIDLVPTGLGGFPAAGYRMMRWLSLAGCGPSLDDVHAYHLASLPLDSLDLTGCTNISDSLVFLRPRMPLARTLRELSLHGCAQLTDVALGILTVRHVPLHVLDLELVWRISSGALVGLSRECRHLTHLYLRGAGSVNRRSLARHLAKDGRDASLAVSYAPRHLSAPGWPLRPLHDLFFTPAGARTRLRYRRPDVDPTFLSDDTAGV